MAPSPSSNRPIVHHRAQLRGLSACRSQVHTWSKWLLSGGGLRSSAPLCGERSVELLVGDYPNLGISTDLLVLAASEDDAAASADSLRGRLQQAYGVRLERLDKALDLRAGPLRCWISAPLDWSRLRHGSETGLSRFERIAVVDPCLDWQADDLLPWPPFNRLFSLLALLPLRRIPCASVATTLLGSGEQGLLDAVVFSPNVLEAYREAFRHVPELQRLILFDRSDEHLSVLGEAIDSALLRAAPQSQRLTLPEPLPGLERLGGLLSSWTRTSAEHPVSLAHDIRELLTLLRAEEISPIALGIHARRVVERLVLQRVSREVGKSRLNLNNGIRLLQQRRADPWMISCLHQVRCFGNWMGHPPLEARAHPVGLSDVVAMLAALQRVLQDEHW